MGKDVFGNRVRAALSDRPPRGRPADRFAKAFHYNNQVVDLIRCGTKPWTAVTQVAKLNSRRPEHISACMKLVADFEQAFTS
jgi:hypothetical protein